VHCARLCLLWAKSGLMQRSKKDRYSITSSARASSDGGTLGRRLDRHVGWLLALEDAIDLIGKLDALVVACASCDRARRYPLSSLSRSRNSKVVHWLDELTADCWKKTSHNIGDQCAARCPDLPRVL
jgi:hypothetical protein